MKPVSKIIRDLYIYRVYKLPSVAGDLDYKILTSLRGRVAVITGPVQTRAFTTLLHTVIFNENL